MQRVMKLRVYWSKMEDNVIQLKVSVEATQICYNAKSFQSRNFPQECHNHAVEDPGRIIGVYIHILNLPLRRR